MKLYEVPRNTWIKVKENHVTPQGGYNIEKDLIFKFHHVDGMYSYCTDKDNAVIHLNASTEVEIIKEPKNIT